MRLPPVSWVRADVTAFSVVDSAWSEADLTMSVGALVVCTAVDTTFVAVPAAAELTCSTVAVAVAAACSSGAVVTGAGSAATGGAEGAAAVTVVAVDWTVAGVAATAGCVAAAATESTGALGSSAFATPAKTAAPATAPTKTVDRNTQRLERFDISE